jgi:hypothetical protein
VPGGAPPWHLPYCVTKEETPIAWQATHPPPKPNEPEASRSPHTLYFDHSFTMAL